MKPEMSVLGIDIAQRVFHVVGMDETGKIHIPPNCVVEDAITRER